MNNQEAIKILKMHRYEMGLPDQGSTWKANADTIACDVAISALEAQQADIWVPLWKKMPDNYSEVYVTTQIGEVYHLFYSNNQFQFGNYSSDLICHSTIAWMPFYIPEPWKEE